jgi:hypothetical protein
MVVAMFPAFYPAIQIGLCPVMPAPGINEQAIVNQHGFITFMKTGGGVDTHGLVVDRPQRLNSPTDSCVNDIFKQAGNMMGAHPVNLEIRVNGIRRVYQFGTSKPVIVQKLQ